MLPPIETDALVIGAGPVGLFQVFQLGLQGFHAHVVDTLPAVGGQCLALYPDKPIYDIPGLPVCTGRELAERLLLQTKPFAPTFHLSQEVAEVAQQPDGRWLLQTTVGTRFLTRTVFIAAGVGAFVARSLRLEGIQAFEGQQVHYQAPEPETLAGQRVVINGADETAVQAAVDAANQKRSGLNAPRSVTLLHRKDVFEAPAPLLAELAALRAADALRVTVGQAVGLQTHDSTPGPRLTGLQIATADDEELTLPVDQLLVFLGLAPRLGPLVNWGLAMERKLLPVDPVSCGTELPGIFAVGDINHYPGKRKLILCGFHEATMAAFAAAQWLTPGQAPVRLQYTTTSTQLQQRLGVAPGPRH
ncbi:NAD(P)/FAD-dependent oxidoreductase [Curvibacter sp. RS43]|uniref:NAD(P)/FAD-dependent oxidoreductase n=1 Tax=Curvibacter microcysteis TaxID=3026419 RepID=UPI00235DE61B|nr:NAD(P)/FAD-dependent oxidoreductase [Curvibacter sp. RS43]MDD0809415.1 NAD(P)/FAD-dependent oxidoreductase [Curvibacter sp. RS43]